MHKGSGDSGELAGKERNSYLRNCLLLLNICNIGCQKGVEHKTPACSVDKKWGSAEVDVIYW